MKDPPRSPFTFTLPFPWHKGHQRHDLFSNSAKGKVQISFPLLLCMQQRRKWAGSEPPIKKAAQPSGIPVKDSYRSCLFLRKRLQHESNTRVPGLVFISPLLTANFRTTFTIFMVQTLVPIDFADID